MSAVVITHLFFLGQKKCWVPDGKNAYIEAEVKESSSDGHVIVETRDGEVKQAFSFWVVCALCLVKSLSISFL